MNDFAKNLMHYNAFVDRINGYGYSVRDNFVYRTVDVGKEGTRPVFRLFIGHPVPVVKENATRFPKYMARRKQNDCE